ncbi:MFS transporter permease [Yersinia massiliensis]|uniref:MFS transporter permease n=2 Tax=Yersinia massiliensis TaxID=419257 RepID=UPI001CFE5046|nr:MFS transporter permease [Yersinia massiliensis]MCB5307687.1 MFS transporter permease [Yersinia massiliensis]
MKQVIIHPISCSQVSRLNITSDENENNESHKIVKDRIINLLHEVSYKKTDSNYTNLMNLMEDAHSVPEIIEGLNNYFRNNNNRNKCKVLIELIKNEQDFLKDENYRLEVRNDHFYLDTQEVKLSSDNPFHTQSDEVSQLIGLYNDVMSHEYKGGKDIKLKDDITTLSEFCDEINRIYSCISSVKRSNLKKSFDKLLASDGVSHIIHGRDNSNNFYQLVKLEIDDKNEQEWYTTESNISYLSSEIRVRLLNDELISPKYSSPEPVKLVKTNLSTAITAISTNPFSNQTYDVEKMIAIYNEMVVKKFNGKKGIGLKENIGSLDELCHEINKIKNDTSETHSSSRYNLLVEFSKNECVEKLLGKMEGVPGDFYTKQKEFICNNGLLFQRMLNGYVNKTEGVSTSQTGHYNKIARDLKNKTIRDNTSIELESNGHIIVRSFPDDNEKIATTLTALLEEHQADGTQYHKVAEFLTVSKLGAYMQLQTLLGGKNAAVVVNQDSVKTINEKITKLSELMDFMSPHLKHINSTLEHFPTKPKSGASLTQLQDYHFEQLLAFDMHASSYTEPQGRFISTKRWIQVKWGNIIGSVTKETYFGGKNDKPKDTIKNLREILNRNLNNQNYEKSVLNGFKYQIVNEGLNRIEHQAKTLNYLISNALIPADLAKNLTFALCYSIASECVDLKQQAKSLNFNRFRTKVKVVVPIVAALSIGVLIAGGVSTVLAPLAPVLAIVICSLGIYYLITKCKPKLEKSDMSKQLTAAMDNLVYQRDFHLDSHDVGWMEAWKYRKGAIKRWWSQPVMPAKKLAEAQTTTLIRNTD